VRGLASTLALALALTCAQTAQAGTLSKTDGGTQYEFSESDGDVGGNNLDVSFCPASACGVNQYIFNDLNDGTAVGAGTGCNLTGDQPANTYFLCPAAGITNVEVILGGGADTLTIDVRAHTAFGGSDGDLDGGRVTVPMTITGGLGGDNVTGGQGGDTISTGDGNDTISAGIGDDVIFGGAGGDTINGGVGTDEVNYAARTIGVTVELGASGPNDGSSEDGPAGSRDNVSVLDIERVVGGSGADDLRGRAGPDFLNGGPGDDALNAAGGSDTVLGGAGIDNVEARDGAADQVDCGTDFDVATTDSIDTRANCDSAPVSPQPEPIVIIQPGPPQPPTPAPPVRALADLGYTFSAGRGATTLRNLSLEAEPGAAVSVSCRVKRKACRGTRDFTRARAAQELRLRGFEGKPLPVGAKLTIRVTKDGMIGAVKTMTIRRGKAPSVKTLCIPPGSASPSAC
jgi:RTX calcium-binding nonapeptide repeat (4 copies)